VVSLAYSDTAIVPSTVSGFLSAEATIFLQQDIIGSQLTHDDRAVFTNLDPLAVLHVLQEFLP